MKPENYLSLNKNRQNFMVILSNGSKIYFEDETQACDFAAARNLPVYTPNDRNLSSWSIAYGNWDK